jgi:hypothetical protein
MQGWNKSGSLYDFEESMISLCPCNRHIDGDYFANLTQRPRSPPQIFRHLFLLEA